MDTHYLVKNDTGSQLKVTLVRSDTGEVIDCTNATVRLYFRKRYNTNILFTLTAQNLAQYLENGIALFLFSDNLNDLEAGYYEGEVEVTFNTGLIETVYEVLPFQVRDDF